MIEGVEVAIFTYEKPGNKHKVSLRSNGKIDVSEICVSYGGGGHAVAAGCTVSGTRKEVENMILNDVIKKLGE
ncbi:3'-to-5' oligoribonuclease A [Lachnospiraceae bacterium TWA4]|nr:3'-to-5' oligoribonuclease A [Lachnospiraceae bacterium TWA4]